MDNLSNILEYGLVPRNILEKLATAESDNAIDFYYNDSLRLDKRTDCNSLSISYPNYPMFRKYYHGQWRNFVILILDTNLLFDPAVTPYFCYTNAATKAIQNLVGRMGWERLSSIDAFNLMFDNELEYRVYYEHRTIKRSEKYPTYQTTDEQAEILVKGIIDPKYILNIVLGNEQQKISIMRYFFENGNNKYPKLIVNNQYFFG